MVNTYVVVFYIKLARNEFRQLFSFLVVLVEIDIHPEGKGVQRHRDFFVALSRELKFKELPAFQVAL